MVKWKLPNYRMLLVFGLIVMFATSVSAANRSLGVSVNQLGDDVSWGANAHLPFDAGPATCDFRVLAQGGDAINGKYNFDVGFDLSAWEVGVFTAGKFKGPSVSDLGRTTDIGIKGGRDFGAVSLSLGVFGRNGGVFGKPSALDVLEDAGFDIGALDASLGDVTAAPTGLSIKAGSSVNALIEAEFDIAAGIHVKVAGMPEISASENRVHQLITTLSSSWDVADNIELNGSLDIGFQTFDGELEREIANLWTLDYEF